jgi:hypothetical protein
MDAKKGTNSQKFKNEHVNKGGFLKVYFLGHVAFCKCFMLEIAALKTEFSELK